MGGLTTHILDTSLGRPAAGVSVELVRLGQQRQSLAVMTTNKDGRCDQPLLQNEAFTAGEYELIFDAGSYFEACGIARETLFLDQVVLRFNVTAADEHYHVPLLLAPFGYSTYRGS